MFRSLDDLLDAIGGWAGNGDADPKPFVWHETAEEIVAEVRGGRAALTRAESPTDH